MRIDPFTTERYFARHEFTAPHLLCASDCETMNVDELLQLAGESWEALGTLQLGYTETQGAPTLRERIAEQYHGVDPDEVIVLAAPEEGIFLSMHALLERGDRVVVLSPCYDSLHNLADYLGCSVKRWWLVEEAEPPDGPGGWRLDLDALERLLQAGPKLVVVNFPHNPTGVLPATGEWQRIVEMVERSGSWLFCDEMYRGLEFDETARLTSGCEIESRTVTLGGLSKAYGLPGLRSGWLVVRDRSLRQQLLGWKDYTTICAGAPGEVLAEVALAIAPVLARRCRRIVLDNLRLADAFFLQWSSLLRWNRPRAGSVALVGLHRHSARELCQAALARYGVLLLPGTCLGSDDRHIRIGLGRKSFPVGLQQLERFLEWERIWPGELVTRKETPE